MAAKHAKRKKETMARQRKMEEESREAGTRMLREAEKARLEEERRTLKVSSGYLVFNI